ncbi:MAG TPA: alpha/beta fold hydrolase [Acidimicrobiales bacterium]|nr:alpha/beta fold hydrolase [Acidimicrobiales bacterium]
MPATTRRSGTNAKSGNGRAPHDRKTGSFPDDAAEEPVAPESIAGGEPASIPALGQILAAAAATLGQGTAVTRESLRFGRELVKIGLGRSAIAPDKGDRRFTDPAWESNPAFHRLEQSYLAASESLGRLIEGLDGRVSDRTAETARFAGGLLAAAASPTNFFWTNPGAIKKAFDTGGASVVRGTRHLVHDLRHNGGFPEMVDRSGFEVGRNLAVSPGAVVERDEIAEVIQYSTRADTVFQRPVLVVPPPIGRFYFLDLAPGRSFVEYATGQGQQVFMLSWRNPTPEQGHWNLDTYAARVSSAITTVQEVTGAPDVNLMVFCAGGIISTVALSHMAATGDDRVHSVSYAVTLLDFGERAPIAAYNSSGLISFARRRSLRKGIITSQQMGSAFTLMRPNDLLFNYVVNNYLLGEKPPAFDILAWNADGTNLPGALHAQFLDIFRHNLLVQAGAVQVLGTPVDLSTIKVPMFVTGAVTDHLTPWRGCYRTTQLLGGESTFVLSYSGHIASLVNPPGNPKAHYWVGGPPVPDPEEWLRGAERRSGSWWERWVEWVEPYSGSKKPAPARLGSSSRPPLEPAPGLYVRDKVPGSAT